MVSGSRNEPVMSSAFSPGSSGESGTDIKQSQTSTGPTKRGSQHRTDGSLGPGDEDDVIHRSMTPQPVPYWPCRRVTSTERQCARPTRRWSLTSDPDDRDGVPYAQTRVAGEVVVDAVPLVIEAQVRSEVRLSSRPTPRKFVGAVLRIPAVGDGAVSSRSVSGELARKGPRGPRIRAGVQGERGAWINSRAPPPISSRWRVGRE